jgi:adenine-specific DNA methylase
LLKTLWVCKKAEKTLVDTPENRSRPDFLRLKKIKKQTKVIINGRRALKLRPNSETKRVRFEIIAPKETADVGVPTMSGSTATCPFCGSQQPGDYIKRCGHEGNLKAQLTAVVYQEKHGKEYRPPTQAEIDAAEVSEKTLSAIADEIPHGIPDDPMPGPETLGFRAPLYGFKKWSNLFTGRQLLALMTFVKWTRATRSEMEKVGYSPEGVEAIEVYLAINVDRLASFNSTICWWLTDLEAMAQTYARFALPITWDFAELNPFSKKTGGYLSHINWVVRFLANVLTAKLTSVPCISQQSSRNLVSQMIDGIITDPPYYDAIPYADLSDFFYLWLRRAIGDRFPETFAEPLTPKSAELVQHSGRFNGDHEAARTFYEDGMAESFRAAHDSLCDDGRMVIVFAHKDPAAWETLTTAMIDAGLVVTASWPIDTERQGGLKGNRAALATSLWLVCRKRPENARAGHYGKVKREMEERITERLRYFWDAGIQGPDFVWAAIGPALESYSSYKEVRRNTGEPFTVSDFLTEVRRIVTDFALGQILGGASTEALDEWTRYYLMHRNHFGTEDAPVGECILLAQGYGVSLDALTANRIGILKKASSGSKLRLLGHTDRNSDRVGQPHSSGGLPMIDMLHRVLTLWEADDGTQLNAYLVEHGLRENALFKAVIQALIETSPPGAKERSLLETIINYQSSPSVNEGGASASGGEAEQQLTIKGVLS